MQTKRLSFAAEVIAKEHQILIRYLEHPYTLKKSTTIFTAWFLLNRVGIYLHLGSRLSCERFLERLTNAN